jgi:1,4-dihydroxy-2-naphthoyl-CoA synthase
MTDNPAQSRVALEVAMELISRQGGDALERATFAWLFATGIPREGLDAFLEKRAPRFQTCTMETT